MEKSIGIFETKGFAAAIAGAEKILENNEIELVKIERTGEGIISLFFKGETEQLTTAFEVGTKHSRMVGEIVAVYVTQESAPKIEQLLFQSSREAETTVTQNKIESKKPIIKKVRKVAEETTAVTEVNKSAKILSSISTIQRLRREALSSDSSLKKRGMKPKSTGSKPSVQINISKLDSMNVHELRGLARSTNGFPIQGREISKANRKELIVYFKELI